MKVNENQNPSTQPSESPHDALAREFWHRLSKDEQEFILKQKFTVGEFMERYKQPSWCSYPDALEGVLGCWSLMTPKLIKRRKDCEDCDSCIGSPAYLREQEWIAKFARPHNEPEREAEIVQD